MHVKTKQRKLTNVNPEDEDLSCSFCYPVEKSDLMTQDFQNFWEEWMKPIFKPMHYTAFTLDYFQRAKLERDFEKQVELLKQLLITIHYKTLPYKGLQS